CVSSRTFSWVRVRRRRALGLPPRARRLRVTRQAARCAALHRALGVLAVDARLAFLLGLDRKARRLALLRLDLPQLLAGDTRRQRADPWTSPCRCHPIPSMETLSTSRSTSSPALLA